MSKFKLVGKHIRRESNGIEVLETQFKEIPQVCKQCNKEPREHGSRRCKKCTTGYKTLKASEQRLQQKIDLQKKSN